MSGASLGPALAAGVFSPWGTPQVHLKLLPCVGTTWLPWAP